MNSCADADVDCLLERLRDDLTAAIGRHPITVPEYLQGGPSGCATDADMATLILRAVDVMAAYEAPLVEGLPELVYGLYVPTFAALAGRNGTLLSALPVLAYARSTLLADAVVLLPLNQVGEVRRKGRSGSPFAVRDPFRIDDRYADPLLPTWSAHDLYHCLLLLGRASGMRVGSIVPLATLSSDCSLIAKFPDLTYWWRATPEERLIARSDHLTPAIRQRDRNRFVVPPAARLLAGVQLGPHGFEVHSEHGPMSPANAIPDVSPAMNATYMWDDVVSVNYTALHYPVPHADYSGTPLELSRAAWHVMPEVVAWHLRHGESLLQIDVLSSVPPAVIELGIELSRADATLAVGGGCCAAADRPHTAEPWVLGEELWTFEGPDVVDAVVGPFVYGAAPFARDLAALTTSLKYHVDLLATTLAPKPFLAGVSTHDTIPPTPAVLPPLLTFLWFLPGGIPFLFSGVENGAPEIVNREFGFTRDEQDLLSYNDMHLFSPEPWRGHAGGWPGSQMHVPLIHMLLAARQSVRSLLTPGAPLRSWRVLDDPSTAGYVVTSPDSALCVAANFAVDHDVGPLAAEGLADHASPSLVWAGRCPDVDRDGLVTVPPRSAAVWVQADLPERATPTAGVRRLSR